MGTELWLTCGWHLPVAPGQPAPPPAPQPGHGDPALSDLPAQDIHVLKWSYQSVKDFAATKTQLLYVVPEQWQPVAFMFPVLGRPDPGWMEGDACPCPAGRRSMWESMRPVSTP